MSRHKGLRIGCPKQDSGQDSGQNWRTGLAAIAGISVGIALFQGVLLRQPTALQPIPSAQSNGIDLFADLLTPEAMASDCCTEDDSQPLVVAQSPTAPLVAARRRGRRPGTALQQLHLSPQQLRELNRIREKSLPQLRTQVAQLQAEKAKLRKLLASNASEGEIEAQFEQVQAARQTLDKFRLGRVQEMRALLTPEQRQTLATQLVGG